MSSLIDCFSDLSASIGIISETWLTDGESLEKEVSDLVLGTGLQMLHQNRPPNQRGFSHGGVAVVYRETAMTLKKKRLHNPRNLEVMVATGSIKGCVRKVVVVGCYIPPNYSVPQGRSTMDFICGVISDIKREMDDPYIIVAGDFNQWKIHEVLADFPDLQEHAVGNTRGDHCIDRIFSNLEVQVAGTVPPLETDRCPESSPKKSDHRISFVQSSVNKVQSYNCLLYTSPSPRDS